MIRPLTAKVGPSSFLLDLPQESSYTMCPTRGGLPCPRPEGSGHQTLGVPG